MIVHSGSSTIVTQPVDMREIILEAVERLLHAPLEMTASSIKPNNDLFQFPGKNFTLRYTFRHIIIVRAVPWFCMPDIYLFIFGYTLLNTPSSISVGISVVMRIP